MNTYRNYIDLLKCILKNFDGEFNCVIKKILSKIFEEYYLNRNDKIYCIDNLYKKFYVGRYNFIKKKYKLCKNTNLIYRFNRSSKRDYIKKLIRLNNLNNDDNINEIIDNILQFNATNYKKHIENMYLEKHLSRLDCKVNEVEEDDFQIILNKRVCHFPPCLNKIIGNNNYCHLHNKDMM